jgi:FkbM family methyltransferase
MCAFPINKKPLMVSYLVQELRAFEREPMVIFDVGARGGVNSEWAVFGDQISVYCFEPDEEECRRLTAEAAPQVHYIASALGRSSGVKTLFEAKLPYSSGLYKTRMEYFDRFLNGDNGVTVAERNVAVRSLDEVIASANIDHVDFIKLDAEGAELDILEGAEATVKSGNFVGVLSEIRLHGEINGSPPFAMLDTFLRRQGFRLFDLEVNRHSRKALPYPQVADYRMPSGERFFAYTARGQVQDGDALYFRDYLLAPALSPLSVLKAASLMEIYSLNDCAAELIDANRQQLKGMADPDRLLDLLASGIEGQNISYQDYLKAYFTDPKVATDFDPATRSSVKANSPKGLLTRLKRWLP